MITRGKKNNILVVTTEGPRKVQSRLRSLKGLNEKSKVTLRDYKQVFIYRVKIFLCYLVSYVKKINGKPWRRRFKRCNDVTTTLFGLL